MQLKREHEDDEPTLKRYKASITSTTNMDTYLEPSGKVKVYIESDSPALLLSQLRSIHAQLRANLLEHISTSVEEVNSQESLGEGVFVYKLVSIFSSMQLLMKFKSHKFPQKPQRKQL